MTAASTTAAALSGDVRPLVHQVMDAFWCHPSRAEALVWGAYPYDSDPAGTAIRPVADHSQHRIAPRAATVLGSRDHWP
jgi:hypothetical protein